MGERHLGPHDLYAFRLPSDPRLGPDGRIAFVVTRADEEHDHYRSRIWSVGGSGSPEALTRGDRDRCPRWSPTGDVLAFLRGTPAQPWLLPLSGGEPWQPCDIDGHVLDMAWSPDGTRLGVLAHLSSHGQERAGDPVEVERLGFKRDGEGLVRGQSHLMVVDVASGEVVPVTSGEHGANGFAWSPDGTRLAFVSARHGDRDLDGVSHVWVVDARGGQPRQVTAWAGAAYTTSWSLEGDQIVLVGQERPSVAEPLELFRVDVEGGRPERLCADLDRNLCVGGLAAGAPAQPVPEGVVVCVKTDTGVSALVAPWDGGPTRPLAGGDGETIGGLHIDAASGRVATVVASPTSPGEVHLDGRAITSLNSGLMESAAPAASTRRSFTAPDGTVTDGWILGRPDPDSPKPLLLDIHGGPHAAWSPALDTIHLYHHQLVGEGWLVLRLNTRGSDGYGRTFFQGLHGAWGRADGDDFLHAVEALVAEGVVDPDRLAVAGYSYGGYMTNWLVGRTGRFAAAVSGGCIANLVSFAGTSDMGARLLEDELGAGLTEAPDLYRTLSPITAVDAVTTPVLLLHGEADLRCPVGQAEEWFTALRRLGRTVRLIRYPDEGHTFRLTGRPSHRIDYAQRLVEWVTAHTDPAARSHP